MTRKYREPRYALSYTFCIWDRWVQRELDRGRTVAEMAAEIGCKPYRVSNIVSKVLQQDSLAEHEAAVRARVDEHRQAVADGIAASRHRLDVLIMYVSAISDQLATSTSNEDPYLRRAFSREH
jgi:predicted DNA-binding protein (UPF0278 family)